MKPNIIIFNPDQFRVDGLSHLGFPGVSTPNLDEMVSTEAMSFSNAFCQNPVCTPSRCSFMTGQYPHVHGHRTMDHMLHGERGEHSLMRILKDNGYYVWWGGKNDLIPGQDGYKSDCDVHYYPSKEDLERWHVSSVINLHGDDGWRGPADGDNYYSFYAGMVDESEQSGVTDNDWLMVRGALDFIEKYDGSKPFLLYLPLLYPHPPYGIEPQFAAMVDKDRIRKRKPDLHDCRYGDKPMILKAIRERQRLRGWSEERFEQLRAVYYGMCARIDYQVGLVREAMKKKGIWDDSMFLFFSDHGDFTGDYGLVEKNQNTFEDSLVKVPLIVKLPSSSKNVNGRCDALTELIDVSATVYDYIGVEPPYWTFGRSLLPIIHGKSNVNRRYVFCEGGRLPGETAANEHTFLDRFREPSETLYFPRVGIQQSESPLYHGKATMIRSDRFKYVKRMNEQDEFYDLVNDPDEEENMIGNPEYADHVQAMKEGMLQWYQETCDVVPFKADLREFRE